jgi:hypothetical protein
MCNSGCFYERRDGSCKGRPKGRLTVKPHCFEGKGDVDAYNESVEDDRILEHDLRQEEAGIFCY